MTDIQKLIELYDNSPAVKAAMIDIAKSVLDAEEAGLLHPRGAFDERLSSALDTYFGLLTDYLRDAT